MTPRWPEGSRARMAHAIILVLLLAILTFVFGFRIIASYIFAPEEVVWDGSASSLVVALILGSLSFVVVLWFGLLRVGRLRFQDLGWRAAAVGPTAMQGLLGFIVALAVVLGISVIGGAALPDLLATLAQYTWKQRCLFFIIGVNAALIEESLFRGYLQPALINRLGTSSGILATAVIFAFYHLNFGLMGLSGKLLLGLIYGVLRDKTNSLLPAGIAHFLVWFVIGSL